MKEKCIRCGKETEYDVASPITTRFFFIVGSGQLCEDCYYTLYPHPPIVTDEDTRRATSELRPENKNSRS